MKLKEFDKVFFIMGLFGFISGIIIILMRNYWGLFPALVGLFYIMKSLKFWQIGDCPSKNNNCEWCKGVGN